MEKRLLTVPELSEYAGIPSATIYSMVCLEKIPAQCIRRIGRSLKFEKSEIDAWISGQNGA